MTAKSILRIAQDTGVTDPDLGLGCTDYGDCSRELVEFFLTACTYERAHCAAICENSIEVAAAAKAIRARDDVDILGPQLKNGLC